MKTNTKAKDFRVDRTEENRLAGGYGPYAAKQSPEALLRRSVLSCLLWERNAYEDGIENTENIKNLIPQVDPQKVFDIAIEARTKQKLRHVPLFIAREMSCLNTHKHLVGDLLPKIIKRADEITEFVAIYWKDGKQPLSKQVKKGLAKSFHNFNEYQFAKYNRKTDVKLRDVMFLVHPKPEQNSELFKKIAEDTLTVPDTWEVSLSTGKDKKETFERLIEERKLGALAFMRNLRNMEKSRVKPSIIRKGFETINNNWLLPLNYFSAAKYAPNWTREIESLMLRDFESMPKLKGHTIFVIDTSGSMGAIISSKSGFSRLDAANAMLLLASERCEHISIYATAGNDGTRKHKTAKVKPVRGFALCEEVIKTSMNIGHGGIFTRQCLEYIKGKEQEKPDRIIIFSDSQDCDHPNRKTPNPFGVKNYIIDVSSHSRGINYEGLWTAEVSGWSENFINYIYQLEQEDIIENN